MKTKNPAGKTRKLDNPYAEWTDARTGFRYRLLKSWQADNSKPYGRWFVAAQSEYTFGNWDMGDEYADNLTRGLRASDLTFDESIWADRRAFLLWAFGG